MSQPEKVTPSYLGPAGQQAPPSIYAVLKDQVMAPQYRDDNLRYVHCPTFVPSHRMCHSGDKTSVPVL